MVRQWQEFFYGPQLTKSHAVASAPNFRENLADALRNSQRGAVTQRSEVGAKRSRRCGQSTTARGLD